MKATWKFLKMALLRAKENTFRFTILFVVGFFVIATVLGVFGLLPREIQVAINPNPLVLGGTSEARAAVVTTGTGASAKAPEVTTSVLSQVPIQYTAQGEIELPTRIVIPRIGTDAKVLNPASASLTVLDEALKQGAVRYPGSGALNQNRPVFLFAHSSYLKVVRNQAFRTFNGLKDLKVGDEVRVEGTIHAYVYRVTSVSFLKDSEASVDLQSNSRTLTLATCDTFGEKQDRIVVTAEFVKSFTK